MLEGDCRVLAYSVDLTRDGIFLTEIVGAAMKKQVHVHIFMLKKKFI